MKPQMPIVERFSAALGAVFPILFLSIVFSNFFFKFRMTTGTRNRISEVCVGHGKENGSMNTKRNPSWWGWVEAPPSPVAVVATTTTTTVSVRSNRSCRPHPLPRSRAVPVRPAAAVGVQCSTEPHRCDEPPTTTVVLHTSTRHTGVR